MDKERFLKSGLIELYVLGLASEEEQALVLEYAAKYPEIQQMIDESVSALDEYARSLNIPPAPHLKAQVTPATVNAPASSFNWLAAVLGVFLLGMSVWVYNLLGQHEQGKQQHSQLQNEFVTLQKDCENKARACQAILAENEFLRHAKTQEVDILGTPLAANARVIAFMNEEVKKCYLQVVDFPAPAKDHEFQVWADIDGEMISMGTVQLDAKGLIEMPFMENAASLNITQEVNGGAAHPNLEQIFASGKV